MCVLSRWLLVSGVVVMRGRSSGVGIFFVGVGVGCVLYGLLLVRGWWWSVVGVMVCTCLYVGELCGGVLLLWRGLVCEFSG